MIVFLMNWLNRSLKYSDFIINLNQKHSALNQSEAYSKRTPSCTEPEVICQLCDPKQTLQSFFYLFI